MDGEFKEAGAMRTSISACDVSTTADANLSVLLPGSASWTSNIVSQIAGMQGEWLPCAV